MACMDLVIDGENEAKFCFKIRENWTNKNETSMLLSCFTILVEVAACNGDINLQ